MKNKIILIALFGLSSNVYGQSVQNNSRQNASARDKSAPVFVTTTTSDAFQAVDLSGSRPAQVTQQVNVVSTSAVSLDSKAKEVNATQTHVNGKLVKTVPEEPVKQLPARKTK